MDDYICEYSEVMPILAEVVRHLYRAGELAYLVGTGYLQEKVEDIWALNPDCAVEVHLNGAPVAAEGCETLFYPDSESGKALAESVQSFLPMATHNPDRGVKPGYFYEDGERAGKLYFLEKTPCPAIIVEPWFLLHEQRFLHDTHRKEKIGMAIAKGILAWEMQS